MPKPPENRAAEFRRRAAELEPLTKKFWCVHVSRLFQEILANDQLAIMAIPLSITGKLLAAVGERAAELNDPKLNSLMARLTIYTVADPDSPDYDPEKTEELLAITED